MITSLYDKKVLSIRKNSGSSGYIRLKSLNKSKSLPKVIIKYGKSLSNLQEKDKVFNEFFRLVFSPKTNFNVENMKCKDQELTNFDTSRVVS